MTHKIRQKQTIRQINEAGVKMTERVQELREDFDDSQNPMVHSLREKVDLVTNNKILLGPPPFLALETDACPKSTPVWDSCTKNFKVPPIGNLPDNDQNSKKVQKQIRFGPNSNIQVFAASQYTCKSRNDFYVT